MQTSQKTLRRVKNRLRVKMLPIRFVGKNIRKQDSMSDFAFFLEMASELARFTKTLVGQDCSKTHLQAIVKEVAHRLISHKFLNFWL